jgi:flagellin
MKKMTLSLNTNVASLTAQRAMLNTNQALETSFERLSTGKRINSASDDAAGLSIGVSIESEVRGLNQAIRNTNDGISMVQIAEGALDEATTILQRMRDLAVQSSNASMGTNELAYLNAEHDKLAVALDDVLSAAKFNGTALIGSSDKGNVLQVGAGTGDLLTVTIAGTNASALGVSAGAVTFGATSSGDAEVVFIGIDTIAENAGDTITITIGDNNFTHTVAASPNEDAATLAELVTIFNDAAITGGASTIGDITGDAWLASATTGGILFTAQQTGTVSNTYVSLAQSASLFNTGAVQVVTEGTADVSGSTAAITAVDAALDTIATNRASLGASQAQLESTVRNLANVAENTAAAAGRIMDTDYAAETANLTKAQILQQAATSILAQANAQPQSVLSLLR